MQAAVPKSSVLIPTAALPGEQLLQEAQISWQGWQRGARVAALVTLVVPGRLCWLWAKMKGNVPEQPQATCHCYVGCQPRLCSLWKNSCFRKCNESKSEGGNWRLRETDPFQHRCHTHRDSSLGWQPGGSRMMATLMSWSVCVQMVATGRSQLGVSREKHCNIALIPFFLPLL